MITCWADKLTATFPGFSWQWSKAPTIACSKTRPRGRTDNARLCAMGWEPRYLLDAAHDDYAAWLTADPAGLDA